MPELQYGVRVKRPVILNDLSTEALAKAEVKDIGVEKGFHRPSPIFFVSLRMTVFKVPLTLNISPWGEKMGKRGRAIGYW
jgi:hypothetical protein